MAISLNNIKNDTRTIDGTYFGDTFKVSYRPSALTPEVESQIRDASEQGDNKVLVNTMCQLITAWDVLDEKEVALPIEPDVMNRLPSALLGAILNACREDMAPKVKNGRR